MTINGTLTLRDFHVFTEWIVTTRLGNVYKLPGQPVDSSGARVAPGKLVSLACTYFANSTLAATNRITCVKTANVTVIPGLVALPTVGVTVRLLVTVQYINSGGCVREGADVSRVESAFNGAGGYVEAMQQCSYGKVNYADDSATVISTAVPCSQEILACDIDAIKAAGRAAAAQQLGSIGSFTHFAYVLPSNINCQVEWQGRSVTWAALANLPGVDTWYQPIDYGIFRQGTVLQESIHNFGIVHGWKGGVEYEDYSTCQGRGDSCPSAPELWHLSWITLLAELNAATLPANTFKTYTLPATYLGPDGAAIRIEPDWLGGSYTKNVYLALRVKAGADVDLLDEFNQKINIHESERTHDSDINDYGDPKNTIIGTVAEGETTDLAAYRLVVRAEALVNSGSKMVVKVCRYQISSSECSGGGDGETATPPSEPSESNTPPAEPSEVNTPPSEPSESNSPPSEPSESNNTPPSEPSEVTTPPSEPSEVTTPPSEPSEVNTPPPAY